MRGAGEQTIVELLEHVDKTRDLTHIDGIVYRKDGALVENKPRAYIQDLDTLPFPHEYAREVLKDYQQYPVNAFRSVFATRGCPYNCTFCGSHRIWSRKVRFRSTASIVKEVQALQKLGLKFIVFEDDTFGAHRAFLIELCEALITHCPGIRWGCELHVKLINDKTISLLKSAGCYSIAIGIESGNNDILQKIKKHITIEEAYTACAIVKKHGLIANTFFMVGFPHETEQTLNDTIRAMKHIKHDTLVYSIFTPYPGSELFEYCKEKGLIGADYNVSLYFHQSPANYFCPNIEPARFKKIISRLERTIDRKNTLNKLQRVLSLNTVRKIQELGIKESLRKGVRLLRGK